MQGLRVVAAIYRIVKCPFRDSNSEPADYRVSRQTLKIPGNMAILKAVQR